jgi:hypothetical protein
MRSCAEQLVDPVRTAICLIDRVSTAKRVCLALLSLMTIVQELALSRTKRRGEAHESNGSSALGYEESICYQKIS